MVYMIYKYVKSIYYERVIVYNHSTGYLPFNTLNSKERKRIDKKEKKKKES